MTTLKLTIREYEGPNNTPAIPLMATAWREMLSARISPNELLYDWDDMVIVALRGDTCVGFLTWKHVKHQKNIWLRVGFVPFAYRRQGIYRAMWGHLIGIAKRLGALQIQSGTATSNETMRRVAAKFGRRQISVITEFDVPAKPRKIRK